MAIIRSRFAGALLGLALGDALGAPLEGGVLERGLWRLIGKTSDNRMRWTDDTQMSLDLAESLFACGKLDQDDLARRFACSYRWSRGYGPGTARVLKYVRSGGDWRKANVAEFPEGSLGNGGAMRSPVIGLFCINQRERLPELARASAVVTHAHPTAQDGAMVVALATFLALGENTSQEVIAALVSEVEVGPMRDRLETVRTWSGRDVSARDVRTQLGDGVLASESCATAVYVALRFLDRGFLEMLQFVAACGGDVDTIGAMAGAIWGARNGAARLPMFQLERLERVEHIQETANKLYDLCTLKHGTA